MTQMALKKYEAENSSSTEGTIIMTEKRNVRADEARNSVRDEDSLR
jgi:hypothetical protein